MMETRVYCLICDELIYDPFAREHFLEDDMGGVSHCPGCGAVHHLVHVLKRSGDEPVEDDE